MTKKQPIEQSGPVPIKNVAAFMAMTVRLRDRDPHLPGIGVCHSPSGYGKSWASIYAQNKTRAIRVEVGDSWTRKTLLLAISRELGVQPKQRLSIAELAEVVIGALGDDLRPLIIDEADKLVDKGMIEIVRELHECSRAPIILIGEEQLPAKLLKVERMHNRVLDWFAAQPCDIDDTRELAKAFAPRIKIADDLLTAVCAQSGGRARRIVVNISRIAEAALNRDAATIDLAKWGGENFYTGEPPHARNVEPFKRAGSRA